MVGFFVCHATGSLVFFFFSSRRRHTRFDCDWSSDVCSSDLPARRLPALVLRYRAMTVTCARCGWQGDDARYCARCGADLIAAPAAPPATFPPPPLRPPTRVSAATRPAGFWIRFVAVL